MEALRESLPPVQSFFLGNEGAESTLPKPKDPNGSWTPGDVISRTQVGALVELSTNPLYLYAMYSVNDTTNQGRYARNKLRDILHQEMLHLALVGNILSALGHSLDLYNFGVVPRYRGHVLMDEIPMDLRPLDAESLGYFIKIESPDTIPFNDPKVIAKEYRSIGELYENLIAGVQRLEDRDFENNKDRQFTEDDFPLLEHLTIITDKATALKGLKLIIEQGEGTGDNSHFKIFSELLERFRSNPWGVYNVPSNPKTEDYKTKPYIYKLSLAFDAAYCYLLQNIQRVWRESVVRNVLIRNIGTIMREVLTPLAQLLVRQPLGNGVAAAPCFNFYPMNTDNPRLPGNPLSPEQLHAQLSNRLQDAVDEAPEAQKPALRSIKGNIDNSKPSE